MKRVCILTGASGSLGTAFIERYSKEYEIVGLHHRRPIYGATQDQSFIDPLRPHQELRTNRHRVHAIRTNLMSRTEIKAAVEQAVAAFGTVDLLINAAGVRRTSALALQATAAVTEVFAVNVTAPLWCSLAVVEVLSRRDPDENVRANRNIVNVSSTAGMFVYADTGQGVYAASKAALNHITYHCASEFWDLGIRVNAVAPDTFPGRVPIATVLDAIVAFDRSTDTGCVLAVSSGNPTMTPVQ